MDAETTTQQGMSRAAKKRAKKKEKQMKDSEDLKSKRPRVDAGGKPPKQPPIDHTDGKGEKLRKTKAKETDGKEEKPRRTKAKETDGKEEKPRKTKAKETDGKEEKSRKTKGTEKDNREPLKLPESYKRLCDIAQSEDEAITSLTSQQRGQAALQFLLHDIPVGEFYSEYSEKEPLCIQRESNGFQRRFDGVLSKQSIQDMLKEHPAYYGRDLNVTRYEKGSDGVKRRVTLDVMKDPSTFADDEEVDPADVSNYVAVDTKSLWKQYKEGCTVRLLCPHKHADDLQSVLSLLELEWGCMVGANAYLTPPGHSQGFAPHYDDIEAFCLQLEGRKRWKVYPPLSKAEHLPRVSSEDFTEEDLKDVEPALDVVLGPGDMLYLPRGWIHQACTLPSRTPEDGHSLHLTISSMQQWAWADLMEILLPEALEAATNSETSSYLRAGLPRRFLDYMGAMHDNRDENVPEILKQMATSLDNEQELESAKQVKELQDSFRVETKKRIMRVATEAMSMLDAVCDQMGKRYLSDRQPPSWTKQEKAVKGSEDEDMLPNRLCRIARQGVARLVLEDGKAIVYHCLENSRVFHEKPLTPLEFELDDAPSIEQLLNTTEPHWICVSDLIHDSIEDKVGVAQALYDEGFLSVRPLDE